MGKGDRRKSNKMKNRVARNKGKERAARHAVAKAKERRGANARPGQTSTKPA